MIETNVTAVIAMTKAFVKGMVVRNKGHIVNIGSVAGKEAYGGKVADA
jgi:3-hydroxy acid dehydrogenase / malonic semialdehyde reductase